MKKLFALLLAVMLIASMAVVASAESTTTLTTTVPAATYTLNIPADQEIPFGAEKTDIGNVTVTNSSGFAEGKNLQVTVSYEDFSCQGVTTTIPYTLIPVSSVGGEIPVTLKSSEYLKFHGLASGEIEEQAKIRVGEGSATIYAVAGLDVSISSANWGKALAGDYTATITFTAEVVVE